MVVRSSFHQNLKLVLKDHEEFVLKESENFNDPIDPSTLAKRKWHD